MAVIPHEEESIIDRIYQSYEKEDRKKELYLARIGSSQIGEPCLRSIYFSWRAFDDKKFGGRMLRLFQTGHIQEERVVQDLRNAGLSVWDKDENEKQFTYNDSTGHFVVKLDGVIKDIPGAEKTPHNLEIKSHNKKSFEELKKKGVREAKPMHFYQMQAGMLFGNLTRALYVSICKDDEDYHVERLREDKVAQAEIQNKIDTLISSTTPPVGISPDGKAFGCKWCDMREVCVGEKTPIRTCRSCVRSEPFPQDGKWVCTLTKNTLTPDEQRAACEHYESIL